MVLIKDCRFPIVLENTKWILDPNEIKFTRGLCRYCGALFSDQPNKL